MPSDSPRSGNVSLVIAISGHRDLYPEDFAGLESEVGNIFSRLKQAYPSTPLLLLSGLAEGADRLAVRAARAASIPYFAVLPMPEDLYRTDFTSEASDAEFEAQLNGAVRRIVLPLAEQSTRDEVALPGAARDLQYERLGRFLVNYSQILIAIWDKRRIGKTGGTSTVVALKLGQLGESGPREMSRMNGNGAGPVHEILARRISCAEMPPGVKYTVTYPDGSGEGDYDAIYGHLEQYNADVARFSAAFAAAAAKSRSGLFEGATPIGLTPAMEWVADVYSWSDTLAIHFANRGLRLWKGVFAFLAVAGVALTWLHVLGGGWLALAAYYACLFFAYIAARWEIRDRRRYRHEDYRALAEALRVQFFWMVAGLPDLASDKYLRKQAGELVWIRDAMSECGLYDGVLERSRRVAEGAAARLGLVQTWVEGQAAYFRRTSLKHDAKRKGFNSFAKAAACVGLIAPLLGLLVPLLAKGAEPPFEEWSHAIAGISMWWAALAWSYSERRGFVQEARQYARMYDLFRGADRELQKRQQETTDEGFGKAEEIIRDLGREALAESGDWLAMHRERKLTAELGVG